MPCNTQSRTIADVDSRYLTESLTTSAIVWGSSLVETLLFCFVLICAVVVHYGPLWTTRRQDLFSRADEKTSEITVD